MIFFEDFETEDAFECCQRILDGIQLSFFSLSLEPGYYDGFYLDIVEDLPDAFAELGEYFDACEEVKDNIKYNMRALVPGWVDNWYTLEETNSCIEDAVSDMLDEIESTPIDLYYDLKYEDFLNTNYLGEDVFECANDLVVEIENYFANKNLNMQVEVLRDSFSEYDEDDDNDFDLMCTMNGITYKLSVTYTMEPDEGDYGGISMDIEDFSI